MEILYKMEKYSEMAGRIILDKIFVCKMMRHAHKCWRQLILT